MNREQMVRDARDALIRHDAAPVVAAGLEYVAGEAVYYSRASAVLDAILPQVSTVEELEALPTRSTLIGHDGSVFETIPNPRVSLLCLGNKRVPEHAGLCVHTGYVLNMFGPLTVVWRPES